MLGLSSSPLDSQPRAHLTEVCSLFVEGRAGQGAEAFISPEGHLSFGDTEEGVKRWASWQQADGRQAAGIPGPLVGLATGSPLCLPFFLVPRAPAVASEGVPGEGGHKAPQQPFPGELLREAITSGCAGSQALQEGGLISR